MCYPGRWARLEYNTLMTIKFLYRPAFVHRHISIKPRGRHRPGSRGRLAVTRWLGCSQNAWPVGAGAGVCVVHLKHEASEGKTAAKLVCQAADCPTARSNTGSSSSLDTVSLIQVGLAHQHTTHTRQEYYRKAVRFLPRFVGLGRIGRPRSLVCWIYAAGVARGPSRTKSCGSQSHDSVI